MTNPDEIPLGRYRHFKGAEYELLGIARDSETEQFVAVYRPLYGDRGLWVRPLAMFLEIIERDGKSQPRFTFIGDNADAKSSPAAPLL